MKILFLHTIMHADSLQQPSTLATLDTPRRPRLISSGTRSEMCCATTSTKPQLAQNARSCKEAEGEGEKGASAIVVEEGQVSVASMCTAGTDRVSPTSFVAPSCTTSSGIPERSCPPLVSDAPVVDKQSSATGVDGEGNCIGRAFSQKDCAGCMQALVHNLQLRRNLAKVTHRLQKACDTQQTHGQRILRAYYEQKLTELARGQQRYATQVLNQQKKCFEEELEHLETEFRTREHALRVQLEQERSRMATMIKAFERERDSVITKTEQTISCLQRKLSQGLSRSSNLEWENAHLLRSLSDKSAIVEALLANAEATDEERRRVDLVAKASVDERARKDRVIDALESEVRDLRHRLSAEVAINAQLLQAIETVEGNRNNDRAKYKDQLSECRTESKKDLDKLSRLVSTIIQDFVDAKGNVSMHSDVNNPETAREP